MAAETVHGLNAIFSHAQLVARTTPWQPRGEDAETWLFVELYRLYCALSGKSKIGVGGPLHRFIEAGAAFLQSRGAGEIEMPTPQSFRSRLRAALKRTPW